MIFSDKPLSTLYGFLVNKSGRLFGKSAFWRRKRVTIKPALGAIYRLPINPRRCELCFTPSKTLCCPACLDDLPRAKHFCASCKLPLTSNAQNICPDCLRNEPDYDACYAACTYSFPVDTIISALKYQKKRYLAELVANVMTKDLAQFANEQNTLPDLLIPIPMTAKKRKLRGFNQTELIAEHLGRTLKIPIIYRALSICGELPSQVGNSRAERLRSMKNRMHVQRPVVANISHVTLIDDVMTTGATIEEATRVLKQAGVARVDVWVFARTPKPNQNP